MDAAVSPVILLIPGFFGYGAFGPDAAPVLEYFAGVKAVLARALPRVTVIAHEPPPTGSLDERVASLHDAIGCLLRGEKLPHAPVVRPVRSVILVGHSTGGVDARLLANPKYRWSGGPTGAERREIIDAVQQIVTISAPFRGTPLVAHARILYDAMLEAVQGLTLLGTFRSSVLDSLGMRWLRAGTLSLLESSFAGASPVAVLKRAAHLAAARSPVSDPGEVARQVGSFLGLVQSNRQLFDDLDVDRMAALEARIAGGDDLSKIVSYVTVSPPPPRFDLGGDVLARFIYRTLYRATAADPVKGPTPRGPALVESTAPAEARRPRPPAGAAELVEAPMSCDGVVPTRSQTLDGRAAYAVLADHLDVVGSYRGGEGADVMRSGSGFDGSRFVALWNDVAARLGRP